jgi:hypothetical protein
MSTRARVGPVIPAIPKVNNTATPCSPIQRGQPCCWPGVMQRHTRGRFGNASLRTRLRRRFTRPEHRSPSRSRFRGLVRASKFQERSALAIQDRASLVVVHHEIRRVANRAGDAHGWGGFSCSSSQIASRPGGAGYRATDLNRATRTARTARTSARDRVYLQQAKDPSSMKRRIRARRPLAAGWSQVASPQ